MTYYTNGFGHLFPVEGAYGFDEVVGTTLTDYAATTGRGSTPALRSDWSSTSRGADSGWAVDLDDDGDLHVGMWIRWAAAGGSPGDGLMRLFTLDIDGSRALQVVAAVGTDYAGDGLASGQVALLDGVDDMGAGGSDLGSLAGDVLAVSTDAGWPTATSGNNERHVTCSFLRGDGSGRFVMTIDGAVVIDQENITNLAVSEGSLTRFLLTLKSSNTSGSWPRTVRVDDLWIDSVTNWGDARVLTYQPVSQGFHDEGVPTGAATGWEAVAGAPPDLGDYITLGDGEKDSHVMDEVSDGERAAVAGVLHRNYLTSDFPTNTFVRIDGTDHETGEVPAKPGGGSGYVVIKTNPDTDAAWTLSDLAALEAGFEGAT